MAKYKTVPSALKMHGAKSYLATKIVKIAETVKHIHWVEPYFGSGAVTLAKNPEGISEVANDLNSCLTDFWNVLQDEKDFLKLQRLLKATPFSEWEFKRAAKAQASTALVLVGWNRIQAAADFFIHCRQSLAGRMKDFAPISRNRVRRGQNEQVSAWLTAIEGLPEVHARIKRILILNQPAVKVIKSQDGKKTLQYLDAPYLHETRTDTKAYGEFEMTNEQHVEMLETVLECQGKFMISGYDSKLYRKMLKKWKRHTFSLPNNAASGPVKRRMEESLWTNF